MARLVIEGLETQQDAAALSNLLRKMELKVEYYPTPEVLRKRQWKVMPGGDMQYDGDVTISLTGVENG